MLIPNLDLYFWNSDPKIHFWANLGRKSQSWSFFLKIRTHGILTMLILIPTLVFWISNHEFISGKIWAKKVKVIQFGWKSAHRVSHRCRFLFRHYFSELRSLNNFLDKFGPKNSKLFVLTNSWHTWYIEDADSYSDNSFFHFWVNLGWKSQSCLFCLKIGTRTHTHRVSWRRWFLFRY